METNTPKEFKKVELILPERDKLAVETVASLEATFLPLYMKGADLVRQASLIHITDVSQTGMMETAKNLRLQIRKVRGEISTAHREAKDESLKKGRIIDSVKNMFLDGVGPAEDYLLEQENFALNAAKKLVEECRAFRLSELGAFSDLVPMPTSDVGMMTESDYKTLYAGAQARHAQEKQRIAEEQAAQLRAARVEQERQTALLADRQKAEAEAAQLRLQMQQQQAEQRQRDEAAAAIRQKEERERFEAQEASRREIESARLAQQRAEFEAREAQERARVLQEEAARQATLPVASMNTRPTMSPIAAIRGAELSAFTDAQLLGGVADALFLFIDQLPMEGQSPNATSILVKLSAHLAQAGNWLKKQQTTLQ